MVSYSCSQRRSVQRSRFHYRTKRNNPFDRSMKERLILIAEDDEQALLSWDLDIREFNGDAKNSIHFVPIVAKSKRAAIKQLERTRVSCAVIDLRLPEEDGNPGGDHSAPLGNCIIEQILLEIGVPAVVYSGYPQEASDLTRASRIRIIQKKGGGAMEALQWLAEHESLMSAMEITQKRMSCESAKLFTESIWPRWETSWKLLEDPDTLAGVITRQIASHVAEQLSLPPTSHHPEEFYVVPPLATGRLATGDLVKRNDTTYVVVTPRCNMARDVYPNHLMLALCKPMEGIWVGMRNRFNGQDPKKQESAAKELQLLATQGYAIGSHFLPPCGLEGPWLVDFREIVTAPCSEVPTLLSSRFASIAPQFIPNLVQRYAAYVGRIGQPDLDCAILRTQVCK
jgi:hypothetical protein